MKNWKGRWLMIVALIHSVVSLVTFSSVFYTIISRGIFNSVGTDPVIGLAVWCTLFGLVLFICGQAINSLEKNGDTRALKVLGWSLLILISIGVILMPVSGFWLAFPPTIAILVDRST